MDGVVEWPAVTVAVETLQLCAPTFRRRIYFLPLVGFQSGRLEQRFEYRRFDPLDHEPGTLRTEPARPLWYLGNVR